MIRVRAGTAAATIALIRGEIHSGSRMILDRLCQVLLLQVLRDHTSDVLTHPRLGPALNTGTVASIAAAAGYRTESAFSAAVKRFAGRSPGEYRTAQ